MEHEAATEQYERDRARLEGEVKGLMRRVQEVEEAKQKKEMNTSSRVAELESQVRHHMICREETRIKGLVSLGSIQLKKLQVHFYATVDCACEV